MIGAHIKLAQNGSLESFLLFEYTSILVPIHFPTFWVYLVVFIGTELRDIINLSARRSVEQSASRVAEQKVTTGSYRTLRL